MDKLYVATRNRIKSFFEEEQGETNIIAIILLILVVVGLVVIFRDKISELINNLFGKVDDSIDANFS
ncbi:MAG: hypothetical protein IK125_07435 [Lachnospiraceae bacterium]|nr:hypothetical protein [Lachnospiraceae bacterium]